MAHAVREAPAAVRKRRTKRRHPEDDGAFRDVIALDIPPNRIIATFPVNVLIKDLPRMEPTIIFEPDDETE
ncbi:MAG: hypothetical protein FJ290_06385 [Planctomycetes bacterium]|nr:hypothetical protein [Planctomycetota bacterium]